VNTAPAANVRVLELFVELLGAQPGRTKAQLRALPGYRGLADDAFETQFQRDKDALRDAGVLLRIGRGEHYSIDRDSFAPDIEVGATDRALLSLAAHAWDRGDVLADSVDAKAAASSEEEVSAPVIRLGLTGLEAATAFARGIRERRVVSFEYPGSGELTLRAVEPWALTVQGRALYLWGWDLDREAERTFRVSRVRSQVEFLGEAGDASVAPSSAVPRVSSLVSPLVEVRCDSAARALLLGYEALAQLGDDPAVRDTVALIEEYHLGLETPVVDLWAERVPATSVSSLLQDAGEFARDMRRPMPVKPSSFSALGTVFHAWAERELHLAGADPATVTQDPSAVVPGEDGALAGGDDGADEALLTLKERELLERLRENCRAFVGGELADYRAVAIEEAFSVEVGGVSVQGRIDAVFERVSGEGPRFLVIDWKSGQPVTASTKPEKLAYFATQLRLYRRAWAARMGVDASEVGAMVAFLAGPSHYTLESLERMLGGGAQPLDEAVKGVLG